MGINGHIILCEDYVSFETAKLLKEKGFDESTCGFYHNDYIGTLLVSNLINHNGSINSVSAPSLGHAMKWLREEHKLYIEIQFGSYDGKSWYSIDIIPTDERYITPDDKFSIEYPTYEQACEAAIKYCLTNLI